MQQLVTELTGEQQLALAPQDLRVYETLAAGRTLTNLIAMTTMNVSSLTSRISVLRKLGLDIKDEWASDHQQKRYKKYWIPQNEHLDQS